MTGLFCFIFLFIFDFSNLFNTRLHNIEGFEMNVELWMLHVQNVSVKSVTRFKQVLQFIFTDTDLLILFPSISNNLMNMYFMAVYFHD